MFEVFRRKEVHTKTGGESMNKTSMQAVEIVLERDPRTRDTKNSWLFLTSVLRELKFRIYIDFSRKMPAPETLFRERREILNKKNKYPLEFIPEEGVTYEK